MKEGGEEVTIYISKEGEKKIWMPDKFVVSRKVKIAENIGDLLARRYS